MGVVVEAVGELRMLARLEVEVESPRSCGAVAFDQRSGRVLQLEQRHAFPSGHLAHHAGVFAVAVVPPALVVEPAPDHRRCEDRPAAASPSLADEVQQVGAILAVGLRVASRVV